MPKPLIAITARRPSDRIEDRGFSGARHGYLEAIVSGGGIPVILPLVRSVDVALELLAKCDGVLVPGGEDVCPIHYGEDPHPLLGATDPDRDALELAVIEAARRERFPLLGICRGHQIINVAFGGTLYQDLRAQRPEAPPHPSPPNASPSNPDTAWLDLIHDLNLQPDSLLARTLGATSLDVNSLHHQAVKEVGNGLAVTGRSSDGLIEALESTDPNHWVVTVQCHPEVLFEQRDERWRGLFGAFVREAARHKTSRLAGVKADTAPV